MRIALIGNYGATNVGDDAILESVLNELKDHSVTVFSANPALTAAQFGVQAQALFPFGVRSLLRRTFFRSFSALKKAEAVILGGGGLFQDDRLYACFLWAWQLFWVKWLKKPLFIWATGVGPLHTSLGKRLAAQSYRYATRITVRDQASYHLLVRIGVSATKIHVTGDPVFSFPPPAPADRKKGRYLISVRPWKNFDSHILEAFSASMAQIKNQKEIDLVWVVMQEIRESDMNLVRQLQKALGGRLLVPESFSDLLKEMSLAEFAIGMRYHFLIAALLTQTLCVPISYSPKVDELFSGTPLEPYLIPVKRISSVQINNKMESALQKADHMRSALALQASVLKEKSDQNRVIFGEFIKTVDPKAGE